jgi:hypothetical protein
MEYNRIVHASFRGDHGVSQVFMHPDTAGRPDKITGDLDTVSPKKGGKIS